MFLAHCESIALTKEVLRHILSNSPPTVCHAILTQPMPILC